LTCLFPVEQGRRALCRPKFRGWLVPSYLRAIFLSKGGHGRMNFLRKAALVCAAAASAAGLALVAAPAATASTDSVLVSCPEHGWSILDGRVGQFFNGNGINIRTGPSTACTAVGQGQASHTVQLDCWK